MSVHRVQKWGAGYSEHRSNMNVINISAKKSEPSSGSSIECCLHNGESP
jgi:hypothetical protein